MLVLFMLLGSAFSKPTDEFKEFSKSNVGGFQSSEIQRHYVPVGTEWQELLSLDPSNKHFQLFNNHIEKGSTWRGLTFCIYDDNLRDAAIALFRLFQTTEGEVFEKVREWAEKNINRDMYMYALRLESLYSSKTNDSTFTPPFIWNPHYFVNAETLDKASLIVNDLSTRGYIDDQMAVVDQYGYPGDMTKKYVLINSNYSGWNLPKDRGSDDLNYFREDVSLNSYYLGIHLLHPFWMTDEELELYNPRFAEHYYYAHQQLMARYKLEKMHWKTGKLTNAWDYIPYLRYKNGLAFPPRPCFKEGWSSETDYLKNLDRSIRQYINSGLLLLANGTDLPMTEEIYLNLLARLIRTNLDGIKVVKLIRLVVGYGGKSYPDDDYNPAPSILHHPETSLKDPFYWTLLQQMLNYFTEYKNRLEPFHLSEYESDEFEIVDHNFSKLVTYFDYYTFPVNHATSNTPFFPNFWPGYVSVRHRRLKHDDFTLKFTVESHVKKDTIVRLFLGPQCSNDCWDSHENFYELDIFPYTLEVGTNIITSSASNSKPSRRLSDDREFDTFRPTDNKPTQFSIFRFPNNLLLPRGREEGLNLTLFVMITPTDEDDVPYPPSFYREVSSELDLKPLGFPFQRIARGFVNNARNYRFYNISIYHRTSVTKDEFGYFSPYLY